MIPLKIISKLLKAFRSGESPEQIAAGFGVGFYIGLMPFWTLQSILLFVVLILVNINLAAGTVAFILADIMYRLLYPLFHTIGQFILNIPFLQPMWESVYNSIFGPLTQFYNTTTMGSFIGGLILYFPIYYGMKKFVVVYREKLEARIKKWKIVQAIKGSKLFQLYEKIRDLGGE